MPSDARTATLSKRYDAADEADNRAYEKRTVTKKLGRKPTNEDYEVEMVQAMKKEMSRTQAIAIARASQPSAKPNDAAIGQMVDAAHVVVLKNLKDPDSAKFDPQDGKAYSLNKDGSLYAVCGEVNAKNGFGGYSGAQAWIMSSQKNGLYQKAARHPRWCIAIAQASSLRGLITGYWTYKVPEAATRAARRFSKTCSRLLPANVAAASNAARASSWRPSLSRRSPRTLGSK